MTKNKTLLVSCSISDEEAIVLVARPRYKGNPEIVNAFEGQDAIDLWNKLNDTSRKPKNNNCISINREI